LLREIQDVDSKIKHLNDTSLLDMVIKGVDHVLNRATVCFPAALECRTEPFELFSGKIFRSSQLMSENELHLEALQFLRIATIVSF
jgi:hypothetical protein